MLYRGKLTEPDEPRGKVIEFAADMLAWATVQELLHAEGIRRLDTPEARIVCMAFEHHRLKLPMAFKRARNSPRGSQTRRRCARLRVYSRAYNSRRYGNLVQSYIADQRVLPDATRLPARVYS